MIKELTIECEEITRVETNRSLGNNIKVTLTKPVRNFLEYVEIQDIVNGMDSDEVMKALVEKHGLEYIRDWHDSLGRS